MPREELAAKLHAAFCAGPGALAAWPVYYSPSIPRLHQQNQFQIMPGGAPVPEAGTRWRAPITITVIWVVAFTWVANSWIQSAFPVKVGHSNPDSNGAALGALWRARMHSTGLSCWKSLCNPHVQRLLYPSTHE